MNNHVDPNRAITLAYVFKIVSVLAGALAIYLGYQLFILGVTGKASLTLKVDTVDGQLTNAAPGLFFAIGGFIIVVFTICKSIEAGSVSGSKNSRQEIQFANAKDPEDKS